MAVITVHVSHDFVGFEIPTKVAFGIKINAALIKPVAVALFPGLPVSAADLLVFNTNLNNAYEAWLANPKLDGDLNNALTAWIGAFNQDATYVDSICKGNAGNIDISGFNKTKDTSVKAVQPVAPVVKSAKSNTPGGLDVDIVKQSDATQFITIAYTSDLSVTFNGNQVTFMKDNGPDKPISQASFYFAKKRRSKFTGLKSKSDVKTQSIAFNAAGGSNPSAPSDNGIL